MMDMILLASNLMMARTFEDTQVGPLQKSKVNNKLDVL